MDTNGKVINQYIAAGGATMGALAMGMVLGWSSPVQPKIDEAYDFTITDDDFAWISSVISLGAAISCIPTGILCDKFGRKITMLVSTIPFLIGWIFVIWPAAVEMLIVGRFILGFSGGTFCVASPLYISEIAHKKIRGLLSSFYQLLIVTGIEIAYIIGGYASVFTLSMVSAVVPLIFAIWFVFMPESPQFLIIKNKTDEAKKSLQWFRGESYNIEQEYNEILYSVEQSRLSKVSFLYVFKNRLARKGVLILMGLMAMQQLSGINAVIFYSNDIFEATGSELSPTVCAIIIGGTQVLFTFPSMILVDKVGRKFCLLVSTFGMAIFISILGFYFAYQEELADQGWLPLTTLILYIVVFAIGAGAVVWVVGAEIFSPEIKGPANGIGATTNWVLAFIVTKFYADISDALGIQVTYWIFGGCCILGALHVIFFVPETKGKTLDEILKIL